MKRQQIRKLLLIISLLLFPVTLYYFSPALIINAGLQGIINGSFILFVLMFLLSVPFGRIFCSYICPAGGLQECSFLINEKKPKQGWKNYIKFVIWGIWIVSVIFCYFHNDKILSVDFFFETESGISVSSIQSYIVYYGIICLIFIPSVLFGKRVFCHYFCWMAPFMILGTKLRRFLHLPGLHIRTGKTDSCIFCGKCNKSCPMGIDVMSKTKCGIVDNSECIQCGACVDNCPKNILSYGMIERKENRNGNREKN
ncbi:4Fe-4S binding protein [Ruminococcus sp. YE282]|jgi:polyferredoxin|uniref:4Fe-4S binding protein n=1 Tax=Ruminococcus sp. YE282 TaxID=3158780 RepID=UPI00088456CE|nr:4Fe-4S binding protein [Ruminococcus bromii]SCY27158.1 4Fe-4S binding domain-containing protein [Ruminococcus bromii]HCB95770.1 4Fe-4S binding protein [Ruminococcus sp.]